MSNQVGDHLIGLATVVGLRKEIQTALDHRHGDGGKGWVQGFRHRIGQVTQHGEEDPGRPEWQFDGILRAAPEPGCSSTGTC